MKATLKKKCRRCMVAARIAGCLFGCSRSERIMREFDALIAGSKADEDPIVEQLKRCPEAYRAGELVGKMFDRLKYRDETDAAERLLPPAGVVIPPV